MKDVRADYFAWKKKHNYTQHETASVIGCTRAAIASFECGRSPYPKGETLLKMLEAIYPQWSDVSVRQNTYKCSDCNTFVPGPLEQASYCCECGSRFGAGCSSCGHINLLGGKFCSECGTKIT